MIPVSELQYSDKYEDDEYEYRHIIIPRKYVDLIPKHNLMTETEWRNLGIQQSPGWIHYLIHPPGDVYEGFLNKDGLKHGVGKLKFSDNSFYEGKFENGFFSGLGVLKFGDKSKYEGEFQKGKMHGYGVYTRHDGMTYAGYFQHGRVNGNGSISSGANFKSEGFFEGNKLVRREQSSDSIKKAHQRSLEARRIKISVK